MGSPVRPQNRRYPIKPKDIIIIELMHKGMSFDEAFKMMRGNEPNAIQKKKDLLRNNTFVKELIKGIDMKDEFKEAGLDEAWLAGQIKQLVEAKDTPVGLKKDMILLAKDILDDNKKGFSGGALAGLVSGNTVPKGQVQLTKTVVGNINDLI